MKRIDWSSILALLGLSREAKKVRDKISDGKRRLPFTKKAIEIHKEVSRIMKEGKENGS